MQVIKRSGNREAVSFNKINARIKAHSLDLKTIDPITISQKVVSQLYDGVKTSELDELTAEICVHMSSENPEFGTLSKRIIISNNHKETLNEFSSCINILYYNKDSNGKPNPLISKELYEMTFKYKNKLNRHIQNKYDYEFDYFGFKTLEKSYLFRVNNKVVERIQYMFMRVSLGLHLNNIENALRSYDYMSQKYFIHGSPTLFNSGTDNPQLLSCFLLGTDDSVRGIYKTLGDCAMISKWSGGIGLHINNIRSKNSVIRGTNGKSNGIIPMLRVYNETARYINQGGKRNGSIAIYIEPHHPDVMSFLDLRKNHGNESERTRDLFTALWVSDLFMKRVHNNEDWSLFDPDMCSELEDLWGDLYETKYVELETSGKASKTLKAREVWKQIITSQTETGTPYILYKDTINKYNNQSNLGTIKSSNLCAEITEYSDSKEYACCTLASIGLPKCVENNSFNFNKLGEVVETIVCNLNRVIDLNYYPVPETKYSNYRHRPIGIGVQGLADVFAMLNYSFESKEAKQLNIKIFDTIYYHALKSSNDLAKIYKEDKRYVYQKLKDLNIEIEGISFMDLYNNILNFKRDNINNSDIQECLSFIENNPSLEYEEKDTGYYSSYQGSPMSKGVFQFEMRGKDFSGNYNSTFDWETLRSDILEYGTRNSLLTALMPTASTSQILGNNECFEPFTSNLYVRRTLAGDFVMVNKHLVKDLQERNMWSNNTKNKIIKANGSIQKIDGIPDHLKRVYKTVWEISQKSLIQLSIDRSPFICQTQSFNLWFAQPNMKTLTSALFYAWQKGLKTGCYYVRSQPKAQAQQFTIDIGKEKKLEQVACSIFNREACEACSA